MLDTATAFSGTARVNYLSTLHFDEDFLSGIASAVAGVEVRQIGAHNAADIDAATWAAVDVLHTSSVLPDPAWTPRLKWIQLDTSGVDHLHREPVWASDIPITTIGGVSAVPLAEYVLWAILGSGHRLPAMMAARETRTWPDPSQRWDTMLPAPVRGATVGIIGYGRIGREIGRLAHAFGMTVLALSRTGGTNRPADQFSAHNGGTEPVQAGPAEVVEQFGPHQLTEVLTRSDYLVVVVPLTAATAHLIDDAAFAVLKLGAMVINVARGGIVDEDALRRALRSGRVRSAVLDVFDREPLPSEDEWWTEPNVFVTTHISGLAPNYLPHVLELVRENLRRFFEGRPLLNEVNRVNGY